MKFTPLLSLFALSALAAAAFGAETVTIGDMSIQVPMPQGFVRLDGANTTLDEKIEKTVPASNQLLMTLAAPQDVAKVKLGNDDQLARYIFVETYRATADRAITQADFAKAVVGIEMHVATKTVTDIQAQANAQLAARKLDTQVEGTEMLGVYDKGNRWIDTGAMMKVKREGSPAKTMVSTTSTIFVHGKLLFLYVFSEYHLSSDVAWNRATAKAWREAILAENHD